MPEEGREIHGAVDAFFWGFMWLCKWTILLPFTVARAAYHHYHLNKPLPTPAPIPAKARPATPDETRGAQTQLQLAHRFFLQAWDKRDYPQESTRALTLAGNAANEARKLDPAASVTVDQHGVQTNYTVDGLSAQILFSQGELLLHAMRLLMGKLRDAKDMSQARANEQQMSEYTRNALAAAKAAVAYQPDNVKYRVLLAKALQANSKTREAKQAIQDALRMEPHNLDALQFKAELG